MTTTKISDDCIIPETVEIGDGVSIGPRVVFVDGVAQPSRVQSGVVIEAAAVIGSGIDIGRDAYVRAGAVVLQSIPPNAIVEGNPAQIVGYRSSSAQHTHAKTDVFDIAAFEGKNAPAATPLGVGNCAAYLLHHVSDARGKLAVGEVDKDLPFTPARYFVVYDAPSRELRGEHAHRACQQFLICVHGSCRIMLDDGVRRCEVTLDRPELGVYMPPMIWGTQYRYSHDAVLLVFASHSYDADDYIRGYDEFRDALDAMKK